MAEKRTFLKSFWQDKKMVGSMVPSSRFLTDKMLKNIDFKHVKLIVELGPGTGVFTRRILELMPSDARLLVFELNTHLYEMLRDQISDERMILIHDSAEFIGKYLQEHGFIHADYVVSSLPLANFPKKLTDTILKEAYLHLKNSGKYIQFQYSLISKKLLEDNFQSVHISFTPMNFPPAFVYTCIKEK